MKPRQNTTSYFFVLIIATIVVGLIAGISGSASALLLHWIQHIAYGYNIHHIISNESFLQGVETTSAGQRVLLLTTCGFTAGFGWYALHRFGQPLIGLKLAINSHRPHLPAISTLSHVLLQTITIALGSPLGREVAPRELSALLTSWFTRCIKLRPKEARILFACGAGAALGAMYNVPLAGAIFSIEVLLKRFNIATILPALTTSAIAVMVAWAFIGNQPLYHLPSFSWDYALLSWSVLMGPVLGYLAFWFIRIANLAQQKTIYDWRFPFMCIGNFFLLGLFAIYFPAILGNGKSSVQLEFYNATSLSLTFTLLVLRTLAVWSSFWVGARGGLLTPSLAMGALLGSIGGYFWNLFWPNPTPGMYAVIGATAFLAAAQNMPITALIIICEFTDIPVNLVTPLALAVVSSMLTEKILRFYYKTI